MKLGPGLMVDVLNWVTKERARFRITDFFAYDGGHIVYGETERHGIDIRRLSREVRGRPACCALIPGAQIKDVGVIVDALRGLPLVFVQGDEILYLLNAARNNGLWSGDIRNKDQMIDHAKQMIDLYHHYKRWGRLPQDVLEKLAAARSGNNGKSLWKPRGY